MKVHGDGVFKDENGERIRSLLFAQNFGDGMSNRRSCFLDFFLRETGGDAHLQGRGYNVLGFVVILKVLETGDENTIREAL